MRKRILFILMIVISIIILYGVCHNYQFYSMPIIRIMDVEKREDSTSSNTLGFSEKYYEDIITGVFMNTKNKGKTVVVKNSSTSSNVVTESYKIGDEVFIEELEVVGLKRDKYVVFLIFLFIMCILFVGHYKGAASIISVLFNMGIFLLGLDFYLKGVDLVFLMLLESIIFTLFSLLIANGFTAKAKAATLSVFVSTLSLIGIVFLVILLHGLEGVNFNSISFLTMPPEEIFLAEIIIGGLGAIMDVAITIAASFDELIMKNPDITRKALISSSREIGQDIMGTMINVLFFTYLCGGLPIFVLALRNGFSFTNYIGSNYSLELTRFLTGSIGIVLTIPISIFICLKFYKREVKA